MGLAKIGLLNVPQILRIGLSKVASCTNPMPAAVIGHRRNRTCPPPVSEYPQRGKCKNVLTQSSQLCFIQ